MSTTPPEPENNSLPIYRLFPNMVTLIGLCFGLFAIKSAMIGQWEKAAIFILIAAFVDGLDGRIARMLNASSNFGAQLDSLSDFINFGVAPALILYMWQTHQIKAVGWAVALIFIVCQALRLARFNTLQEKEKDETDPFKKVISDKFFMGVPAPVGASLSLLPMLLSFLFEERFPGLLPYLTPAISIAYMLIIAFLMVSTIPTISIKKMGIRKEHSMFFLVFAGVLIIALIVEPWVFFPVIGIIYLASIPLTTAWYYRLLGQKGEH